VNDCERSRMIIGVQAKERHELLNYQNCKMRIDIYQSLFGIKKFLEKGFHIFKLYSKQIR
jgi:hypothetical protein